MRWVDAQRQRQYIPIYLRSFSSAWIHIFMVFFGKWWTQCDWGRPLCRWCWLVLVCLVVLCTFAGDSFIYSTNYQLNGNIIGLVEALKKKFGCAADWMLQCPSRFPNFFTVELSRWNLLFHRFRSPLQWKPFEWVVQFKNVKQHLDVVSNL